MKNTQNRTKKTDWVDTHVYLPKDLLKQLKEDARQTGRTFQGMIRWALAGYYESLKKGPTE